jgi:flagellar hook-associated protein 1 FlgK
MGLSTAANIAQSSLATVSAESAVTSRNISGASATGTYSRKVANVVTTSSGAQVISVTRLQNQALFSTLLGATASAATQSAISAGLDQLNQTVGSVDSTDTSTVAGNSPSALLSTFTDAMQSYASQPSSTTLATDAVSAASNLADGLNSATSTVQDVREQADSGMVTAVTTINSLLTQFGTLNTQVMNGSATGADVTDAEDARDDILKQLSQQIGITTVGGKNNDISIYTDSGATLFQDGARSVTMQPTTTYTAGTTGKAVYVDGIPVTGAGATMPITTGNLAGLATLRDNTTVTYQTQLDQMASSLITTFKETYQGTSGGGPDQAGLFTNGGSTTLPTSNVGLAGSISISANVDPTQGGNVNLLRDGGISDTSDSNYTYNTTNAASYGDRISGLIANLTAPATYSTSGQIETSGTLATYAAGSVAWLEAQRSSTSSASSYSTTLLSTATTALSNATGVSLDDEMSKMLDIENSYSASAKLLTTINSMFTTFLTDLGA